MIRSEARAQVAANQPDAAKSAEGPDGQAVAAATAPSPQADRPAVAPGRAGPPWLVRNSRKVTIALVIVIFAASPFAYRYLQREFGPDPLAGIKLDGVKVDAITGISEVVKPTEIIPADVKPAVTKSVATVRQTEPAQKLLSPRPSASPASSVAAAPSAPSVGVTHTRPAVAAPVTPVTPAPDASKQNSKPRANAREEQTLSRACTDALAALGLCDPNATVKGK